jgi:apolipoprotein N-acyltransferase
VLLPFGTARWTIPLAAWLFPVFLLRFARTQPRRRGILLVLLGTALVLEVASFGFLGPMPLVLAVPLIFGIGILITLPYVVDRVVAPRLGGMLGTLVFPAAVTTVWYLFALVSPFGTVYNPAYTQYGNLPLLQLLSVTGLWGIVFLMSWLASVVNWAWERDFAWPKVRGGAALYGGLLALVLLFGGARLALFPAQASAVRVAGISASPALIDAAAVPAAQLPHETLDRIVTGSTTPADRAAIRQAWAAVDAQLFALSEQEARAGAKIVVWPECASQAWGEDEVAYLTRVGALARSTGAYVDVGLCGTLQQPIAPYYGYDESVLIDPSGSIVWR